MIASNGDRDVYILSVLPTSCLGCLLYTFVICLFVSTQAIKQKLHMRSRVGEETPLTDVQQEEDKMKMLLGAKLLVSKLVKVKQNKFEWQR
jgi:hypothetical protein